MKKIVLLTLLLLCFNSGSILAVEKLTDQETHFIQAISKDFIKTHQIDLSGYQFFDIRQSTTNENALESSLRKISIDIAKNQYFVDCSPLFYLNQEKGKGLVLEKKLDGTNNLYILTLDPSSQEWKLTDKVGKMGTDLADLGIIKGKR